MGGLTHPVTSKRGSDHSGCPAVGEGMDPALSLLTDSTRSSQVCIEAQRGGWGVLPGPWSGDRAELCTGPRCSGSGGAWF